MYHNLSLILFAIKWDSKRDRNMGRQFHEHSDGQMTQIHVLDAYCLS